MTSRTEVAVRNIVLMPTPRLEEKAEDLKEEMRKCTLKEHRDRGSDI